LRTGSESESRSPWITLAYSLSNLTLFFIAIFMVLVTVPVVVAAQSVSGAMAVSATVLPPDRSRAPQLISFSVARTGLARLETAAPMAGAVSQIVMVTISSPTNRFAPVRQAPTLVTATHGINRLGATMSSDTSAAQRRAFEIDVGRLTTAENQDTVSVRITYLIVPGT
jgi:hypothetical protein